MKRIPLSIYLNKEEIIKLAGRYHFNDTDLYQVTCIYEAMKPMVRPMAYYKIGKGKEDLSFIEYSSFVVCIVSLGIEIDNLQNLYSETEAVLEEYIVECISMELLSKAYEQLANKIHEKHGHWLKAYDFLGDKYSLEKMEDIFNYMPQSTVTYNEALMLLPKKSVVFIAELTDSKEDVNCSICDNCGNTNCPNRNQVNATNGSDKDNTKSNEKDNTTNKDIKEKNLSYGYQRIFGKEISHQ